MVPISRFPLGGGWTVGLLVGIVVLSALFPPVKADYTILVGQNGGVSVQISGSFVQGVPNISANNTADIFQSIPIFHSRLQGGNASLLSNSLNKAIRARNSSANASQVSLDAKSNGTRLDYDLTFQVTGVVQSTGVATMIDLSWRSFTITDDVGAENISINKVFPTYLQNQIETLASQGSGSTQSGRLIWWFNNLRTTPGEIPSDTSNLLLFDFHRLNLPLQNWNGTTSLKSSETRLRASTGFNVTLIQQISEPGQTANFATDAVYHINAVIVAPFTTVAMGDILSFEGSGAAQQYQLMLVIIVAPFIVLVTTFLVEKRYSTRTRSREKGRRGSR